MSPRTYRQKLKHTAEERRRRRRKFYDVHPKIDFRSREYLELQQYVSKISPCKVCGSRGELLRDLTTETPRVMMHCPKCHTFTYSGVSKKHLVREWNFMNTGDTHEY